MRPGLYSQSRAKSRGERRPFQFLRLRRDQWLTNFQKMAGITCFRRSGEAQSRDVACYVSTAKFRIPPRILLLLTVFIVSAKSAPQWRVQFEPTRIVNGSPVLFRVTAPTAVKELTGNFLGQEINFRRSSRCRCWYAISGVSLNTKPGRY